jgi:hypothetical protein
MAKLIKQFCLECGKEHTIGYQFDGQEPVYYEDLHKGDFENDESEKLD